MSAARVSPFLCACATFASAFVHSNIQRSVTDIALTAFTLKYKYIKEKTGKRQRQKMPPSRQLGCLANVMQLNREKKQADSQCRVCICSPCPRVFLFSHFILIVTQRLAQIQTLLRWCSPSFAIRVSTYFSLSPTSGKREFKTGQYFWPWRNSQNKREEKLPGLLLSSRERRISSQVSRCHATSDTRSHHMTW